MPLGEWAERREYRERGRVARLCEDQPLGRDRGGAGVLERLGWNALSYGPFRTFFVANFAGNTSWFVFNAGFGWFILTATGSAAIEGLAFFIAGLPFLLLTLHAGLLTDRYGAKRLVSLSFFLTGVTMMGLGALALVPNAPLVLILGVAFLTGTFQTIGAPGYISIVNDLVPAGDVSSAVALNFLGISIGRIAGGIIGGFLVAVFPPASAIVVGGLLQAIPALPISRLPTPPFVPPPTSSRSLVRPILEAAGFAIRYRTLGVILVLSAVPGALGLSYNYLLPVAARDFGIGGQGLAVLLAMAGIGGLVAGLLAETIMRAAGHGRAIFIGLWTSAAGMLIFGLSPLLEVSVASTTLIGGGFVIYAAASLSLVQALSPSTIRGRVTSLFALLYWGLMPVGGLIGGIVAEAAGSRVAFTLAGACLVGAGGLAIVARRQIIALRVHRDGTTVANGVAVEFAA